MTEHIAIIASHDGNTITPSTWERYAFAQKLKKHTGTGICFIFIGENIEKLAAAVSSKTGCPAIAAHVPNTGNYHGELYKKALILIFATHPHAYVLAPHSTSGMDYAPAISIALNGSCITDVKGLIKSDGPLCFVRSMFNEKIQAELKCPEVSNASPLVMTLRQGALKPVVPDGTFAPKVICHRFDFNEEKMFYKGTRPSPSHESGLAKAQVIISGGRGIEVEENYHLIEELAGVFPRAATGASRPICDYRWVPYQKQVGATGNIVSPKLYMACGISGATQHLEGIRNAQFVIAINNDPDAPIFQVADICVVEDLVSFIPILVEAIERSLGTISPPGCNHPANRLAKTIGMH